MVEVNRMLAMLKEHRQELQRRRDAVHKAIAVLAGALTPAAETPPAELNAPAGPAASAALSTRVQARRVQSDAHKEAVTAGKRRARAAREAAKGLAREMPDDSFVPAIRARGDSQSPRLVKRPSKE